MNKNIIQVGSFSNPQNITKANNYTHCLWIMSQPQDAKMWRACCMSNGHQRLQHLSNGIDYKPYAFLFL